MSNEQSKGFEESPRDVIGRKRTVLGDVARMKPLPEAEGEMNCVVGMVNQLFAYHPWDTTEQIEAGQNVRTALAQAYLAIVRNVPPSPSRTRALNMITDARMLANQAITFKGEV